MSKSVLSKEEAEKVAVAYSPQRFPAHVTKTAQSFVAFNSGATTGKASSFRIDKIVAEQTGVAEIERISMEEKVEREALVRVKEIQEEAFQQAYQLGLDEGREKAFAENQTILGEKIDHLNGLLASIENLKPDLIAANEAMIVRLTYYMAKRLLFQEVAERPEVILEVVRQSILAAQSEEKVTVRVSAVDYQFIDSVREKLGKEFEPVKRAKLESSEEIATGGCIVETNYGNVNSTLDQRLEKLWTAVSEKFPKVKGVIGVD